MLARLSSHSAGDTSPIARTRNVPTLLIRMSTRPARAVTARTISATAAGSRNSARTANADAAAGANLLHHPGSPRLPRSDSAPPPRRRAPPAPAPARARCAAPPRLPAPPARATPAPAAGPLTAGDGACRRKPVRNRSCAALACGVRRRERRGPRRRRSHPPGAVQRARPADGYCAPRRLDRRLEPLGSRWCRRDATPGASPPGGQSGGREERRPPRPGRCRRAGRVPPGPAPAAGSA